MAFLFVLTPISKPLPVNTESTIAANKSENVSTTKGGTNRVAYLMITATVLFLLRTSLAMKVSFLVIGIGLGHVLGQFDWNKIRSRIDKRNVVILYATDGGFYSILLFLFLIQIAPGSIASFIKVFRSHPSIPPFLIGFLSQSVRLIT